MYKIIFINEEIEKYQSAQLWHLYTNTDPASVVKGWQNAATTTSSVPYLLLLLLLLILLIIIIITETIVCILVHCLLWC